MCKWIVALILALLGLYPRAAEAAPRSAAARAAFQRAHPCPANGLRRGACPGYVVDHVVPLCAGGADAPRNMRWQTVGAARKKDRKERRECARKGAR